MIYYQDIDFGREKSNSYEIKNSAGGWLVLISVYAEDPEIA
jgi:hypothetical protein